MARRALVIEPTTAQVCAARAEERKGKSLAKRAVLAAELTADALEAIRFELAKLSDAVRHVAAASRSPQS